MKPIAPFEHERKLETDAILVLEPDSDKFFIKNSDERLEAFGTNVLSTTRGIWGYNSYPNFDTGTVCQLKICPQTNYNCNGCYLTNVDGSNVGKVLLPSKTVSKTAHTITEDFIVKNDNTANSATVIDSGESLTNWSTLYYATATTPTVTLEGGRVKVVGTTDANGRLALQKIVSLNLSAKQFVTLDVESSVSGNVYFLYGSALWTAYKYWSTRSSITLNTNSRFVYPILAPVGASGKNPVGGAGSITMTAVSVIHVGIIATAGIEVTFYIDNICSDIGKEAYIEMNVPDNLALNSLELLCDGGSGYATTRIDKLDTTYSNTSTDATKTKFFDGTLVDDVYGSGLGRAVFCKGSSDTIASGSTGTMYYSENKGTKYRIGLKITLPPSDNGRTNFNKIKLRTVLRYADDDKNVIYDLSGNRQHGTLAGNVVKTSSGWVFDGDVTSKITIPAITLSRANSKIEFTFKGGSTDAVQRAIVGRAASQYYSYVSFKGGNRAIEGESNTNGEYYGTLILPVSDVFRTVTLTFLNNVLTLTDGTVSSNTTVTNDLTLDLIGNTYNGSAVVKPFIGTISEIKMWNNGVLVRCYKSTTNNMGVATCEFTNDNSHFTGLLNIEKPLMGWVTDNGVEFYVFDRQLKVLNIREDEDKTSEVIVGVTKGTKVYHGYISYKNKTKDSNSDGIPDVIDAIERMCKRVQEVQEVWLQVSFTPAVATNDFSILLADCEQSYPVSAGTVVYSNGVLQNPLRTGNSLSYYDVVGKTLKYKENDDRSKDCKVWDTGTTGELDETKWKRVYSLDYVFTGDKVIDNGLIRYKQTINSTSLIIYYYNAVYSQFGICSITSNSLSLVSISLEAVVFTVVSTELSTVTIRKGSYLSLASKRLIINGVVGNGKFIVTNDLVYNTRLTNLAASGFVTIDTSPYAVGVTPTKSYIEVFVPTSGNIRSWVFANNIGHSSIEGTSTTTVRSIGVIPFDCSKIHTDVVNMTGGVII